MNYDNEIAKLKYHISILLMINRFPNVRLYQMIIDFDLDKNDFLQFVKVFNECFIDNNLNKEKIKYLLSSNYKMTDLAIDQLIKGYKEFKNIDYVS